jgi:heterodisulfide reductase subunit C
MYKIAKENLSALFQKIAGTQDLILPIENRGQVNYGLWTEDANVDIDTLKSVKSPKDAFFPQSENLYTCVRDGKKIEITAEELQKKDFVVFGMKACDIQGVEVLDKVFLAEPVDTFYAARREHGTIVALACNEPEETCFCKVFGIDASDPKADVATWLVDGDLCWKPLTKKGEALTEAVKELLSDDASKDAAVEAKKADIKSIIEKLPYSNLSLEGWNGDALTEKFNSSVWEELYKPCLACGTCTFVCPTCQCYDIKDYDTGHGIQRYRCWDSCMYSDFTMMAHGNNRTSQMQRFRQRFMHKLVYFPANNDGMYSCVGCGRCVEKCPSALNIVKVIKAFENQGGEN